ncbi:MAG: MFS transporter [Hyphomicrobiales bacterium]|nr:MFS transporter [Hyphomicrobiales bacterium]
MTTTAETKPVRAAMPLLVLAACVCIVFLTYGTRQSFGIYLRPITAEYGWAVQTMSLALAIQALIYGLSAPFIGALADRFGTIKVLGFAGLLYGFGIFMMSQSTTPAAMIFSAGFIGGVGSAGCALSLVLAIASRVAPEEKRSLWLGLITSGGTGGQLVLVPLGAKIMEYHGWYPAMVSLAAVVMLILPLAFLIKYSSGDILTNKKDERGLKQALLEAKEHHGFWLLAMGFFTCGFQVQYINAHLPGYLQDQGMQPIVAATAISVIGVFNVIGTSLSGWLGGRYRKKYLLASLYLGRSVIFVVFLLAPLSPTSVYIFAAAIGTLWLATVPLTSGIVLGMFGSRYMATLYGIVFFFHQVGSFTSVWIGGIVRDTTGNYMVAWWIIIVVGTLASFIHWPIDDRPVEEVLADRRAAAA